MSSTGRTGGCLGTSDVIVRLGGAQDVGDICRICAEGFRFVASELLPSEVVEHQVAAYYMPERIAAEVEPSAFTRSWGGYIVAEVDGQVVGAAGGGMDDDFIGHFYVLYLDLKHLGRGLGTLLLDAVSEQQRRLGATRQRVAVLEGNRHGLPFYLARGFSRIDRRTYPAGGADGVPELVLERSL